MECLSPVLVTDSVRNGDFGDLSQDSPRRRIHEFQRPLVIGLLEAVLGTLPRQRVSNHLDTDIHCYGPHVLGEATTIDSHDDPSVGQYCVGLLEVTDILESRSYVRIYHSSCLNSSPTLFLPF